MRLHLPAIREGAWTQKRSLWTTGIIFQKTIAFKAAIHCAPSAWLSFWRATTRKPRSAERTCFWRSRAQSVPVNTAKPWRTCLATMWQCEKPCHQSQSLHQLQGQGYYFVAPLVPGELRLPADLDDSTAPEARRNNLSCLLPCQVSFGLPVAPWYFRQCASDPI